MRSAAVNVGRPTSSTQAKQTTKKVTKPKKTVSKDTKTEEEEREQDLALLQAQILGYYRNRADAFESDRTQLYGKLDAIRLKQDLAHNTEWELKKRTEEKAELEAALEKCQAVLYCERDKILSMKRESVALRVKQRGNKK